MHSSRQHLITIVFLVLAISPSMGSAFPDNGPSTHTRKARGCSLPMHQNIYAIMKSEAGKVCSHVAWHRITLRLRGGGSTRQFMANSCYPLHGEGDTEGDEVGEQDDPYSVAHVAAKPMGPAADPVEQSFVEMLQEEPDDLETLASYANFLMTIRGDVQRAAEMAWRASQINPQHWWVQKYASKYLPPHMVPPYIPAPREAYHQVEEPPPPEVPDNVPDEELSFLQLMVREQQKLLRDQQEKQAQGLEVEPPPLTVHTGEAMDEQYVNRAEPEQDILFDTPGGGQQDSGANYQTEHDSPLQPASDEEM